MLTYADVCLTYEFWRVLNEKGMSKETLRKVF